jgi:hypothetical protein
VSAERYVNSPIVQKLAGSPAIEIAGSERRWGKLDDG